MVLAARAVHVPAGVGIDEGTRPEHIEFGAKSLACVNVRQDKRGLLVTRLGFTALSAGLFDGTTATAGYRMFADRDTIVRITAAPQAEVYSTKAGAWQSLGRVPEAACRLVDLPSVGASTYLEDIDATNGYIAVSWMAFANPTTTTCDAYIAILDQSSGGIVRVAEKVGTSTSNTPSLLAVEGNYFITVRYNATGTKLEAFYLDTTSKTTINAGWVAFGAALCADTTGVKTYLHSIPVGSGSARVAVLYSNTSGGTDRLTLKTFTVAGGVLQTKTINTASNTPTALALGGLSTDTLWVTWNEGFNVRVTGLDPFTITATALAATATLIVMATGCLYLGICANDTAAGKARVWGNEQSGLTLGKMRGIQTSAATATADGATTSVPTAVMARKPFCRSGVFYSAFADTATNTQQNFIVCDWSATSSYLRPIAQGVPSLSTLGSAWQGKFIAGTTSTKYYAGFGVKRSGVAEGSVFAELDFASTARWQPTSFGNSVYLSGGVPSYSDGSRVAEIGFLLRPITPTPTLSGTGITGTYKYICVYEEVDADGNWHQSGLSSPSASTSPANQTVTIAALPLCITARGAASATANSLRVAFYRTLTGGVSPYYRLATVSNDVSAGTVTYADTTSDTTLAANAKLYSQPGVLNTSQDKRPPPPFSSVVAYNGMLVGAFGSDLWYSGQNVSGEGVWFNPIFQVPVPGDGDITALAVLDGALFAFKRSEVWAVAGEAPADNGSSGGLGQPRRLAVDVGCIDARSTCTTALGVFFQSDRGIEILTRAQTVEWIGEPVQDTLASFPYCTSATVDPVSCTVLLELSSAQTSGLVTGTGRTLVFDLSLKVWVSTDRRRSTAGGVDVAAQGGCMVRSGTAYRYAWMSAAGTVEVENNTYLDGSGVYWITPQWETSWAKFGLQQEQMLWSGLVLFQRYGAAGLKVEVAYDYAAYSAANDKTWTEAQTLGQLQLDLRPKPRGQAMKFRVSATAPAVLGTGQGIAFVGLSLDMAPKQGATRGTPLLDTSLRK